jgi:hypothetical protein
MSVSTEPITPAQMRFLLTLMSQRASLFGIEPTTESAKSWIESKNANITKSQASKLISELKDKPVDVITPAKSSQSEVFYSYDCSHIVDAGTSGMTRIIQNKFAKSCELCGHDVAYMSGLAVMSQSGWSTWHLKGECIEPAKPSSILAKRVEAFIAEACADLDGDAYFALPSHTGNNDLDFYGFVVSRRKTGTIYVLKRIVGGAFHHEDTSNSPVMSLTEAKRVMDAIEAMDSAQWDEAQMQFAQNLGRCFHCNRILTDDESRKRGMGAKCAEGGY